MKRAAVAFITILGSVALARAQTSPSSPKPNPELHRQFDYFVGTWKLTGATKPSSLARLGQAFESTERLEWMPGGFFLVAHSYHQDSWVGLTVISYDEDAGSFAHASYSGAGTVEVMRGTAVGNTVVLSGKVGGRAAQQRMTIEKISPELYTFKLEVASEGGDWSLVYEGRGVKTS